MSKTDIPVISVVTPTFNRANELYFLVQSIQNQTLDHSLFEMIIADDGSTDHTEILIQSLKDKIDFTLKIFTQKNQGPGAARNYGIKNSKGELILFIDSDCEADSLWMETIYDYYKEEGFDACGGPDGRLVSRARRLAGGPASVIRRPRASGTGEGERDRDTSVAADQRHRCHHRRRAPCAAQQCRRSGGGGAHPATGARRAWSSAGSMPGCTTAA